MAITTITFFNNMSLMKIHRNNHVLLRLNLR